MLSLPGMLVTQRAWITYASSLWASTRKVLPPSPPPMYLGHGEARALDIGHRIAGEMVSPESDAQRLDRPHDGATYRMGGGSMFGQDEPPTWPENAVGLSARGQWVWDRADGEGRDDAVGALVGHVQDLDVSVVQVNVFETFIGYAFTGDVEHPHG